MHLIEFVNQSEIIQFVKWSVYLIHFFVKKCFRFLPESKKLESNVFSF